MDTCNYAEAVIEEWPHSTLKILHQLSKALNEFAHATERLRDDPDNLDLDSPTFHNQLAWQLHTLPFADVCPACKTACWPHTMVDGSDKDYRYICHECESTWTCRWLDGHNRISVTPH